MTGSLPAGHPTLVLLSNRVMTLQEFNHLNSETQIGQQLAARLVPGLHREVIVVCISATGFPLADAVAGALHAASLYVPTVDIFDPADPRKVIGVVNIGCAVTHEERDVPGDYVYRQTRQMQQDLRRQSPGQAKVFDKVLRGRDVVIVDDVVHDPTAIRATIRLISDFEPARVIVAAPIITNEAFVQLKLDADEVFALDTLSPQMRVS